MSANVHEVFSGVGLVVRLMVAPEPSLLKPEGMAFHQPAAVP
jgi:hypothetical protein